MSSLIPFAALYTKEGRSKILNAPTRQWRIQHIVQYLGIKHELSKSMVLFTKGKVNALALDIRRTVRDLLSVTCGPKELSKPGSAPTKLELRDEPAFINIARTMSKEYGPLLWGSEAREHLHQPPEVRGYQGLYWDRPADAEVVQFLLRCWLIRQAHLLRRRSKNPRTARPPQKNTKKPELVAATTTNRSPNARLSFAAGNDSDSDDVPLVQRHARMQAKNANNLNDSDSDDTPLVPKCVRSRNQHVKVDSDSDSDDMPLIRRRIRDRSKIAYDPDADYKPGDDDSLPPVYQRPMEGEPDRTSSRESSTFSDLCREHSFSICSNDIENKYETHVKPQTSPSQEPYLWTPHRSVDETLTDESTVPKLLRDLCMMLRHQENQKLGISEVIDLGSSPPSSPGNSPSRKRSLGAVIPERESRHDTGKREAGGFGGCRLRLEVRKQPE